MKKLYFLAFLSIVTCSAFAQIKVTTNGDIEVGSTTSAIVKMLMSGNNYMDASDALGNLVFRTGGTNNRFIIYSNGNAQFLGNLGIGVSSPSVALEVDGIIEASGNISGAIGFFTDDSDYQLRLYGPNGWAGIKFQDNGGDDHIWYNGTNKTFSIGSNGANKSGKKLHIHGGTSIGTGFVSSSVPLNGLAIEGRVGIGTIVPETNLNVIGAIQVGLNGDAYHSTLGANGLIFDRTGPSYIDFEDNGNSLSFRQGSAHSLVMHLSSSGDVGIGTTDTHGRKLAVDGNATFRNEVSASDFEVYMVGSTTIGTTTTPWPDYVFKQDYILLSLKQVEQHIKEKGHLPNIPSAKEVEEKGSYSLGEMTKKLLEKVEELTLYTIQQEKRIKALEAKLAQKKE